MDDFQFVFDRHTIDLLRRFRFFKDHGIFSYSEKYDDLPAFWADAIDIMATNYKLALEAKNADQKT